MNNTHSLADALKLTKNTVPEETYYHTLMSLKIANNLSRLAGLTEEDKYLLMKAVALHAINKNKRQAFDYLRIKGWDEEVCLLVLHSWEVLDLTKLPEDLHVIHRILIISSICSSQQGWLQTIPRGLNNILKTCKTQYDKDYARIVADSARVWLDDFSRGKELIVANASSSKHPN